MQDNFNVIKYFSLVKYSYLTFRTWIGLTLEGNLRLCGANTLVKSFVGLRTLSCREVEDGGRENLSADESK